MSMSKPYVILPVGVPGAGKSTTLNFLIGDVNCTTFEAKRASEGVTRNIKIVANKPLLGKHQDCIITLIDVPGIGDPTLSLDLILEECERKVSTKTIDAVLLVLKATDDRISLGEVVMMNTFRLIKGINAANVIIVLTRCDQELDIDDAFIEERLGKLSSFAKKCQLDLDPSQVVRFDKTTSSLEPIKSLLTRGSMQFEENLVEKAQEIIQDLPEVIRGSSVSMEQLAELTKAMEAMQLQHSERMAQMEQDRKERETIMQQLVTQAQTVAEDQRKYHDEQMRMLTAQMERANERAAQAARDAADAARSAASNRGGTCCVC